MITYNDSITFFPLKENNLKKKGKCNGATDFHERDKLKSKWNIAL